ncbi:PorP/SprF family type IX secretion system membrane protein [Ohtaekwangia koreensis]|uniref:Type IX secretion system membrane protein, PorP/SprF family n=1 Tax=Ohtaekwangia koreensis TaxID=688867 RepID=A0A1T5KIL4_9BACT|nr:PorP/SprF family type IX secretion system membrane protein [Ohtaekwangia koreensis]SKC63500.1 type IX secretion system membrane protein, PorP/SprF family [Ohtaekwangia koreensis]
MKLPFKLLLFAAVWCIMYPLQAQQSPVYSHYFLNPFLYNPSFVAPNGYTEVYLNYRNQWAGVEGAPVTGTLSFHLPLSYKAGIAFTGSQDKAGVLKTTTGLATFAYQVYLGNKVGDNHKIAFGLSAGVTSVSIRADDGYSNDPVVGATSTFEGQFGMHYQRGNFKLAFAIPRLFNTYVASENNFNKVGISQVRNTISSASYSIYFSDRMVFEPMVIYRTNDNTNAQLEGLGSLVINSIVWVGGSYRQRYGASAFAGTNIKDKLKVGYAYEFATGSTNTLGAGTHEIQLIVQLGKKKRPEAKTKLKTIGGSSQVSEANETGISNTNETIVQQERPAETDKSSSPVETAQHQEEARQAEMHASALVPVDTPDGSQTKVITQSLSGEGLAPGHYVVVGVFRSPAYAKQYAFNLKRANYPAEVAYYHEKHYYIVHMNNAPPTRELAQKLCNEYRRMSRYTFRDTWILSIE